MNKYISFPRVCEINERLSDQQLIAIDGLLSLINQMQEVIISKIQDSYSNLSDVITEACKNYEQLLSDEILENFKKSFMRQLKNKRRKKIYVDLSFDFAYRSEQSCFKKGKHLRFPLTNEFKNKYNLDESVDILIPFYDVYPAGESDLLLNNYSIYKTQDGRIFLKLLFLKKVPNIYRKHKGILSIDLGYSNFATCANSLNGQSFIVDGKYLRNIKHNFNQYKKKIIKSNKTIKQKKYLINIAKEKKNKRITDYINKTASLIIKYVEDEKINTIAIGFSDIVYRKKNKKTKIYNREHKRLVEQIKKICLLRGIGFKKVNESYSSIADCTIEEILIPGIKSKLSKRKKKDYRPSRGKFLSKIGPINADVNAAINIALLAGAKSDPDKRNIGLLKNPIRINPIKLRLLKSNNIQKYLK